MKATTSVSVGRLLLTALVWASVGITGLAYADTAVQTDPQGMASAGFGAVPSLELQELESTRGMDGNIIHLNNVQSIQEMEANVSNPNFTVIGGDMVTGGITFENNSLSGFSGTGIFNGITGNGNAVNNAIGISVFIAN